jgi:cysteine desulfurase
MAVNNEIGAQWDARDLPAQTRFVDATQALGKVALDLDGIDYAAFSAHKLYGPQGIGALFTASGSIEPLLKGGEQEEGRRAGTLNVAGIVGFGAACALAQDRIEEDRAHVRELRQILIDRFQCLSDWHVNGGDDAVPHILSVSFLGLQGETLVIEADGAGFAISAGAACSSRSTEPSHVLTALGMPEEWRRGTVRISFGRGNTRESTDALGKTLVRSAENLRTIA